MNPLKKLAGQTAIYGLSSIVPRFLNYLLVPLYTRVFIPEEYGVVTELYAYVTFVLVILTYGLETGYFRFAEKNNEDKVYTTSVLFLFVSSFLFVSGVIYFAKDIAAWLDYEGRSIYVTWFAIIIGIDAFLAVPFARLRQRNEALKFTLYKILSVVVNVLANILFLVIFPYLEERGVNISDTILYNPDIGVGYVFLSNLIANLIVFVIFIPELFKIQFVFSYDVLKSLLKYSLPLMIAGLAGTVNESLDRALLKHLLPENVNALEQLGLYGANVKVAVLMTLFIQMFRFAAEPFFFDYARESDSRTVFADVMKFFIIFGIFIFLSVALFIDVIKYFIGSDYYSGLGIVPILLAANLFLGIFFNLSIWYKLNNKTIYGAVLTFIGAFITIAVNVFFVPLYGYHASAWGRFSCYFIMVIISYFLGQKHYYINYETKRIFIYLFTGVLLYVIFILSRVQILFLQMIISTFLLFVYVFLVFKLEKIHISNILIRPFKGKN